MAGPTVRYYERDIITPGPGLTELNVPAKKFQGFDPVTGDAILKDLTPFDAFTGQTNIRPPVAGTISGSMPTATTADCSVSYTDPDDGRPPVLTWHWYRDGVERGTTTEPDRDFTFGSVPNDGAVHSFFVRGESDDGIGDPSNLLNLQFGGPSVPAPTALTQFARHNLTSAQVDFTWTVPAPADNRVDKLALFRQGQTPGVNTPLVDNIDPAALGTTLVFSTIGLGPGDRITNIGVARHIPTAGAPNNGWSPISNVISFNIPVAQVQHDVVMGCTVNDEWTSAKVSRYPAMDACRTYSFGTAVGDLNLTGARVLGVTPDGSSGEGGNIRTTTGVVNALRNALENFYYNTDGTPRSGNRNPQTGCEYHFALDNETDRGANPSTIYINNHRDCRAVIHEIDPDTGQRRYPRASLWIDLTQNNIRNGGSGTSFKPVARYLDGFACSMYPPGRQGHSQPTGLPRCDDNIIFSNYAQYIDEVITTVQDWMLTGSATGGVSPITMFATWEIGIPIDFPYRDCQCTGTCPPTTGGGNTECGGHVYSTQFPSGEPTDRTNFSIRPRYMTGGIDSTGKDWTGVLQYIYDKLDAIGCIMREQLYWNQQSNPAIPNPMWHDQSGRDWDARTLPAPCATQNSFGTTRANIDLETAWFSWVPGKRLPTATSN